MCVCAGVQVSCHQFRGSWKSSWHGPSILVRQGPGTPPPSDVCVAKAHEWRARREAEAAKAAAAVLSAAVAAAKVAREKQHGQGGRGEDDPGPNDLDPLFVTPLLLAEHGDLLGPGEGLDTLGPGEGLDPGGGPDPAAAVVAVVASEAGSVGDATQDLDLLAAATTAGRPAAGISSS